MTAPKRLTGSRFGKLVAVRDAGRSKYGRVLWECMCDCGRRVTLPSMYLLARDGTRSCGCLRKERPRPADAKRLGLRFGRLQVVRRVNAEKYLLTCDCGGERVARWCNVKAGRVKSCGCLRTVYDLPNGARGTLTELARQLGVPLARVRWRRTKLGMSLADAFLVGKSVRGPVVEALGCRGDLGHLAERSGLSPQTVRRRLAAGASLFDALTRPKRTWKAYKVVAPAQAGVEALREVRQVRQVGDDLLRLLGVA